MEVQCTTCSSILKRSPSVIKEKNFCNHGCYSVFKRQQWSGSNNPRWSGGEITRQCKRCLKEFTTKRYGKKREQVYCSNHCSQKDFGKYHRQENHWAWNGGSGTITKPIRSLNKYRDWMGDVIARDHGKCQHCDSNQNLHVHHIKPLAVLVNEYEGILDPYDEVFYELTNGITLCKTCHRKAHKKIGRIAGNPTWAISSRA